MTTPDGGQRHRYLAEFRDDGSPETYVCITCNDTVEYHVDDPRYSPAATCPATVQEPQP